MTKTYSIMAFVCRIALSLASSTSTALPVCSLLLGSNKLPNIQESLVAMPRLHTLWPTNSTYARVEDKLKALDRDVANAYLRRLSAVFQQVSIAALHGRLTYAISLLEDPLLIEGTGFYLLPLERRKVFMVQTAADMIPKTGRTLGGVHDAGIVDIARIVMSVGGDKVADLDQAILNGRPEVDTLRMLYLQVQVEEIGHVTQYLKERVTGSPYLSRAMAIDLLRSEVEEMAIDLRRVRGDDVGYEHEADIYAFMIELFGRKRVPFWKGTHTGYETRRLVDEVYRLSL